MTDTSFIVAGYGGNGRAGRAAERVVSDALPGVQFTDPADSSLRTVSQALALRAVAKRTAVANANYTALATDAYVGFSSLTATRTVTLPAASSFPPGQTLYIADETGNCSPTVQIIVARAGSDTIAAATSIALGSPYQKLAFHSNGSNLWTYA